MKTKTPQRREIAANIERVMGAPHAPADDGRFMHDRIVAANASLFSESTFSEPLTAFASGYRDTNDLEASLGFYAPEVPVGRRFEYAQHDNAEEFLSETDDERAIGADFAEVEYSESRVNAKTVNRGLKICIDLDEVADKDGWEERYTQKLLRRLRRNALRRALALLSAAATNTAKTWDTTAGKDPDQDVIADLVTAANSSGIKPNRVGYGDTAWSKRLLAHRAQDSAGGFSSAGLTAEQLAGVLGVERVHHSLERYQTGAATKAEVVGALVLMFFAQDALDQEDPSNIKRFVSPTNAGTAYSVYSRQETEKLHVIAVEHYELTAITSTLGIRKFTVS